MSRASGIPYETLSSYSMEEYFNIFIGTHEMSQRDKKRLEEVRSKSGRSRSRRR